jgi:nicotinamide-nucleotide amidase
MFLAETHALVSQLAQALTRRRWQLATAESCTGGLVSAALTELAGSSVWFDRGFVTYSNASKIAQLGVNPWLIESHGAVSQAVAHAMAAGAIDRSDANFALSITGVAGPGGGSEGKPVGTVWHGFAIASEQGIATEAFLKHYAGTRAEVRAQAVQFALEQALATIAAHS